ncbi:MAG TPA: aspartyl protease family protein [Verrucomicrobiae bacterium]
MNFLFDTGAEVSVINTDTAKALHLAGGRKIRVQGVDTATSGRWPVRLTAKAGTLDLPEKYLSLDLTLLGRSCARHLDGLLGADAIRGKVVEIDFESHEIRFLDQVVVAKNEVVLPLKSSNGCFCAPVGINQGAPQWLRIDTGCATPLQWVTTDRKMSIVSRRPAIGLAGATIPQTETAVSVGSEKFASVPTGLHRRAIFAGESGLLGLGLLHHFKTVTIDSKSLRLVLTPLSDCPASSVTF